MSPVFKTVTVHVAVRQVAWPTVHDHKLHIGCINRYPFALIQCCALAPLRVVAILNINPSALADFA